MTFQEYINNPTGVGNSVMSYRSMYEDLYHNKWDKIMVRENGKIDYKLYYSKNHYYCHLKIPSEVVEDFYYDVVIKMKEPDGAKSLKNTEVQFFSNDPNFNYTFAYTFVKHKLHIPELEKRMSQKAIHKKANEKNPQNTIGYIKSLYFAFIAMGNKGLFNKNKYKSEGSKFSAKILMSNIMDTEDCIEQRQELAQQQAEKRKEEKDKRTKRPSKDSIISPEIFNGGYINTIKPKTGIGTIGKRSLMGNNRGINVIKKKRKR